MSRREAALISRDVVTWRYANTRVVKHAFKQPGDPVPICGTEIKDMSRRPVRWMDYPGLLEKLRECRSCARRLESV